MELSKVDWWALDTTGTTQGVKRSSLRLASIVADLILVLQYERKICRLEIIGIHKVSDHHSLTSL